MVLLIVFSSILAYIFIGLVVGKVWRIKSENKCHTCQRYGSGSCRKDHQVSAIFAGLLWPVGPLFVLVCVALSQSSDRLALYFTKSK